MLQEIILDKIVEFFETLDPDGENFEFTKFLFTKINNKQGKKIVTGIDFQHSERT